MIVKELSRLRGLLCAFIMPVALAVDEPLKIDPGLPVYEKVSGVTGNITSVGSDTRNNLMVLWSEGFRKKYPNVNLQIESKGSSTAPPALIERNAQLGPMSRPMKEEIESFEKRMGYRPTPVGVALDALAVFVHKDNPVEVMTLDQIDAVFSKTRRSGYPKPITTWGDPVPESRIADPISLYGRNSASGIYVYFKRMPLFKGDFKDQLKEQPGSSSVVMAVTEEIAGIGYSGIGYRTSGVKIVKLAAVPGQPGYEATPENIMTKRYPLGRLLFVYVNKPPNKEPPPVVDQFPRYALSREGQEIVVKSGYIPLPAKVAERQAAVLKAM